MSVYFVLVSMDIRKITRLANYDETDKQTGLENRPIYRQDPGIMRGCCAK